MGAEKFEFKYLIDTELSRGITKVLPDFLKHNYLLQKLKYRNARNIGVTVQDGRHLVKYGV